MRKSYLNPCLFLFTGVAGVGSVRETVGFLSEYCFHISVALKQCCFNNLLILLHNKLTRRAFEQLKPYDKSIGLLCCVVLLSSMTAFEPLRWH